MSNAGQFAQDADILLRVGTKASSTVKTAGWFDTIILDVEAIINCASVFDFSTADDGATITASVRGILIDTGACLAAIEGIIFDMSGFTSRIEAEDMINVLRDRALFNMAILKDKNVQAFVIDPTVGNV